MEEYRSGTVTAIVDSGTVVTVVVGLEDGGTYPVHFDHRRFRHMVEAVAVGPAELIGRHMEVLQEEGAEYVRLPDMVGDY